MEIEVKKIPVKYFTDDGFSTPLYELIELLEALDETDGFFDFISIDSKITEDYLLSKNLAKKSVRGSLYKPINSGNILSKFINELYQMDKKYQLEI